MLLNLEKLERLFWDRYKTLLGEALDEEEFFVNYCDKHKIVMMHHEWVQECFNEPRKTRICVLSPERTKNSPQWLLVPRRFAEKALVLGFLP